MSDLAGTIAALRDSVCRPDAPADRTIELDRPTPLADLEALLGPAYELPAMAFRHQRVQFNDTIPAEGTTGATVLADVDDDGNVVSVTARRDSL